MSAPALSFFILIILAIAVFFVWLIYSRRYQRASQEAAFVRTGYGGKKVVTYGGALVFPVLHEVTPVNMNTMRLEVVRANNQALITKDRMRMDVQAEFYVRVKPTIEDIAMAAQTLGRRTMNPDALKNLVEGKFVNALRAVAAEMNMDELHQNRGEFVRRVQEAVGDGLLKNGLELESVSLSELDQTDRKYFNPQNAFDAEGLMILTEIIQARAKQRNVIERDTEVAIKKKDLEAERQKLDLIKEEEFARLEQEREIQVRRAEQQARIITEKVEKERLAREAELLARQQVEHIQLTTEQELEEERISKDISIKEKEINRQKQLQTAEAERDRIIEETRIKTQQEVHAARTAADKAMEAERLAKEQELAAIELEKTRHVEELKINQDLVLKEKAITAGRQLEAAEIEKQRLLNETRLQVEQELDKLKVQVDKEIEHERIIRQQELRKHEIESKRNIGAAEIDLDRLLDQARIVADREVTKARIHKEMEMEEEKINKDKAIRSMEIAKAQTLETADIERHKAIELAEVGKLIEVLEKSREHLLAQVEVDRTRAEAVKAEESIQTVRQLEIAERQKAVEILEAEKMVAREAITIVETAEARLNAAIKQAESVGIVAGGEAEKIKTIAEAEAEAELVRIKAVDERYMTDAKGRKALHEAENILDPAKSESRIKMAIIEHLAEIIRESVKPMESIEGIKIMHVEGLPGSTTGGGNSEGTGGGNLADQLVNSALRYRGQAPLLDSVLKEIGLTGADINGMTTPIRDQIRSQPEEEPDEE